MKQVNNIRTENLLLTQACANTYWSQHNELFTFLNNIEKQLSLIRPYSTLREQIKCAKGNYNKLSAEFLNNQIKFHGILQQHSSQLLTLISNNQEIQCNLHELEQESNNIQTNLHACQKDLERVSTWFDNTSFPTTIENSNEFEHIRTFKEHSDCEYLDIINLKY
jgi:chromosome segregation ATPase